MSLSPGGGGLVLVIARKPISLNAGGKEKHKKAIAEEARLRFRGPPLTGELYARILWFHRERPGGRDGDADNICKPIIDALNGIAYRDDLQVVKRLVHKVYMSNELDFEEAGRPPGVLAEILRLIGMAEKHIIYIEIGPLRSTKVSFGPIDEGRS